MAENLTPEQREAFYDAEIATTLAELAKKCQDNDLSLLAMVEWGDPETHGRTCTIAKDGSFHFRWVEAAARCCKVAGGAFNVDGFMIAIARDTVQNKRPHSSMALDRWGIHPDPARRDDATSQQEGASHD